MKLRKIFYIPIIILCSLVLHACIEGINNETRADIIFKNKSNSKILVTITNLDYKPYSSYKEVTTILQPKDTFAIRFTQEFLSTNTLKFTVYTDSTIAKYSKEELQKLDINDSVYICTLDYLKSCNYVLVYDKIRK